MSASLPFTRAERLRLYWWTDHGWLRSLWTNFEKIDAEVWRHTHPSPARLAQLKAMGAASVLSLRGSTSPPSRIEAAACAELGLAFRPIAMRAHALPSKEALLDLINTLRTSSKPLVIHCKSGSDRTGLAATLYLHVIKAVPLGEARGQLALRYIHNPWGKAAIVNRLLDAYAAQAKPFEDWVRDDYDQIGLMG